MKLKEYIKKNKWNIYKNLYMYKRNSRNAIAIEANSAACELSKTNKEY